MAVATLSEPEPLGLRQRLLRGERRTLHAQPRRGRLLVEAGHAVEAQHARVVRVAAWPTARADGVRRRRSCGAVDRASPRCRRGRWHRSAPTAAPCRPRPRTARRRPTVTVALRPNADSSTCSKPDDATAVFAEALGDASTGGAIDLDRRIAEPFVEPCVGLLARRDRGVGDHATRRPHRFVELLRQRARVGLAWGSRRAPTRARATSSATRRRDSRRAARALRRVRIGRGGGR